MDCDQTVIGIPPITSAVFVIHLSLYSSETPTLYKKMLAMRNTAGVTSGNAIAVLLQSISGVSPINPLVAFYDVHGGKREVLFFYYVPNTTRDQERTR
jgi:hypothetical protein